jgi:two-component system response regulator YesN
MSTRNMKKSFIMHNKKSAFISLLLSYLLIFLIPVSIGVVLYGQIESIMRANASRSNLAMIEQLRQTMDSRLKEVDQLSQQIAYNPRLQVLLSSANMNSPSVQFKFVEFRNDMSRYRSFSNLVSDFFVHIKSGDYIITSNMLTNADIFYEYFYTYEGLDVEQWRQQFLDLYQFKRYWPVQSVRESGNLKNFITYTQSLSIGTMEATKGTLVLLLDEQVLKDMLDKIEWVNQGAVYIMSESNEVLMSTDGESDRITQILSEIKQPSGQLNLAYEGQQHMVAYASSEMNGWTYISIVPTRVFLEQVNQVKLWAFLVLTFCLIGGALASYLMAYRNYSPVRELISVIYKRKGKNVTSGELANEYDFIKTVVLTAFDEEKQLRDMLSSQTPVIRANFLSRLIRGHVDVTSTTSDSLAFMGIHLTSNRYRIIIIDIEDCRKFVKGDTEHEWVLVRFVIGNIASEMLEHKAYITELDRSRLAILINDDGALNREDQQPIHQFANEMKHMVESRFRTSITIAVSSVHEGANAPGLCYQEAMKAMDYKVIRGQGAIIYYDEMRSIDAHYYFYPAETEARLMNFTKSGDYDQAAELLDYIYDTNINTDFMTPELGKCLFYDIAGTLLKTLNSLNIEYETLFQKGSTPLARLANCSTIEEMHGETKSYYQSVCEFIQSIQRTGHRDRLLDAIIEYVSQSYDDSMISLSSISDHFHITPQYLSTFFKKHSGQNLIDYIAQLRIDKAKLLMHDKTLNLTRIALEIGYTNDVSFIRVFKKLEGITPGKFRDNIRVS